MSASESGSQKAGLLDHLRDAVGHALEAVRCYLALFTAEAQERFDRSVRSALWFAALLAAGIVGLVFVASGLSELLDSWIKAPGAGRMIVGVLLAGGFVAVVAAMPRKPKD